MFCLCRVGRQIISALNLQVWFLGGNSIQRLKVLALVTALMLGTVVVTMAEETPPSTFRDTATVTLIEVPVVVLRGGMPVTGLTSSDFVLTMDGVEQTVESFEQVDLSVTTTTDVQRVQSTQPPVSLAGRRYFLLAFDLSHTQPANARRAVEAARDLLESGLHPKDLVGVSIYSAVAGARLLHPFTSNQAELELALLAVEAVTSRDQEVVQRAQETLAAADDESVENLVGFLEEIRRFTAKQAVGLESTLGPAGEWLVGYDVSGGGAILAETLGDMEAFNDENQIAIVRSRSLDFLETLADLATALEGIRGQKYFVLFSEGIDQSFFEDYANTQGLQRMSRSLSSFRRSGWVMQSVNVTRGTKIERGMFALVDETGGKEYREFNRLDEAMGQMLQQTSVSYVLSFQPEGLVHDGTYHRVDVRLGQRAGAVVRHRDGFYAPQADDGNVSGDSLVAVGDRIASERDGGPFQVSAVAVPLKNTTESALVKTVVEINGAELLLNQETPLVSLEIDTYLVGDDVGVVNLSTRRMTLDVAKQGELVRGGGVKVVEDFLLRPGEHRLRISVADPESGRRSVATVPVHVPDFDSDEPQILEPIFPEISRNWVVVRDNQGEVDSVERPDFEFGGRKYVPRAEVVLESDTVVPVFVLVFGVPEDATPVRLELVGADGNLQEGRFLEIRSAPERTEEGLLQVMAELNTAGLEPARYEIRAIYENHPGGSAVAASRFVQIR